MSTKTQTDRKRTDPTTDTPHTTIRDAVLADASPNIADAAVLDGLLWLVEDDCAQATVTGAGRMVDFDDYNGVRL